MSASSAPTETAIAVRAHDAVKIYGKGDAAVRALNNISVEFKRGQFTAIMGASGSGKSTLLHCLAGLDRLTSGEVFIGATQLGSLKEKELTRLRRDRVGFIFQSFNLVPTLTAEDNITLPLSIAGRKADAANMKSVVDALRLGNRLKHRPSELSGGQQQRVAAARALVSRPEIIFADEPTGNLDSHSSQEMLEFLRHAVDQMGQTIIMVTHDPGAASRADRTVFLADGAVIKDLVHPSAPDILDVMKSLTGS